MPNATPSSSRFRSVCVFCGSSVGSHPTYAESAHALGLELALRDIALVYGGGNVGLMGVVADAALGAGGRVLGVMPRHLVEREIAHRTLTELHVVDSMHSRKQMMADLADAFVLLPGGFGSWEEFCEVVTWSQLGLHRKPCGILDVLDYYRPLLEMMSRAVEHGFVRASHRDAIVVSRDPTNLLMKLEDAPVSTETKWIGRA